MVRYQCWFAVTHCVYFPGRCGSFARIQHTRGHWGTINCLDEQAIASIALLLPPLLCYCLHCFAIASTALLLPPLLCYCLHCFDVSSQTAHKAIY